MILVNALPVGRLCLYKGLPLMKIKSAKLRTTTVMGKLQFQPLFSSTQTMTVELMSPPVHKEKKNQLKKEEICL